MADLAYLWTLEVQYNYVKYLSYRDRSLFHWSVLMRDNTQQVRYNGKSAELVSQLACTALQQNISDMWRCIYVL